jgi:hypothetical protein
MPTFRCPDCGKIAKTITEAEDIAATCDDKDCGMGNLRPRSSRVKRKEVDQ